MEEKGEKGRKKGSQEERKKEKKKEKSITTSSPVFIAPLFSVLASMCENCQSKTCNVQGSFRRDTK